MFVSRGFMRATDPPLGRRFYHATSLAADDQTHRTLQGQRQIPARSHLSRISTVRAHDIPFSFLATTITMV
jgi:hypothetical protein